MTQEETLIRIQWEGPFTPQKLGDADQSKWGFLHPRIKAESASVEETLNDASKDFGVYQIYGAHPHYGTDVLLYIGLADAQTFAQRLNNPDKVLGENMTVYVGRLANAEGVESPSDNEWSKQIKWAEKLLIFNHSPAYNAQNIRSLYNLAAPEGLGNAIVRVRNYGEYRSLMPEMSSDYWPDHATQQDIFNKDGDLAPYIYDPKAK